MSTPIGWDEVAYLEEFSVDDRFALGRALTPMEKLVTAFNRVDHAAGLGWTGIRSRCWWTTDGRRVTLTLHDLGGGHTVRISMIADPRFLEEKEEAA